MQFRIRHTPMLGTNIMHMARSLGVWLFSGIFTPSKGIITEIGHFFFVTEDGKYIVQE